MIARRDKAAPATQIGTKETWIAFGDLAIWGFIMYGLGTATPYLRQDLRLTAFEAGLHGSALAVGVLIAGAATDRVARLIGVRWLPDLEVAIIALGIALLALAPSLPVSLAGALLIGVGGAILSTDNNVRLGRVKGDGGRRLLAQAYGLSMIMAGAAPLAIGLAASELDSWRLALLIPIVAFALVATLRTRGPEAARVVHEKKPRLSAAYWTACLLIALGVSIEFSFVYWGSTMVGRRAGIGNADATLLAALFVVGMFLGRVAVGRGVGGGLSPRTLLAGGLVVAMIGAGVVWASSIAALSGLGLFLGGLGTAVLYPVGLNVALQAAPHAQMTAAARAAFGTGIALLVAPSALGLASDTLGLMAAWAIIPGIALVGLLVVAAMRGPGASPAEELPALEESLPLGQASA